MNWSSAYVGIPYANMGRDRRGCDCWGLARLIYFEKLSIKLPDYSAGYACSEEQAEIATLIGKETTASAWQQVTEFLPFDLLVFRHGRHQSHIGVFLAPGLMLHMATDDQSKVERFDTGRWKSRFTAAFHFAGSDIRGVL